LLEGMNFRDVILMEGRQRLDVGVGSDLDLVFEQFEGRLGPTGLLLDRILLHLNQIAEGPLSRVVGEDEGEAIVASGDGGVLVREDDGRERQEGQADGLDVTRTASGQIHEAHSRIMSDKRKAIARG